MNRFWLAAVTSLLATAGLMGSTAHAFTPNELTIIVLKMTGSESIVIRNSTASQIDLVDDAGNYNYIVQYFNKTDPGIAVPTNTLQLPNFKLLPSQTILLNGDSSATCGAAAVADLPFGLSDSAGYIRLVKVTASSSGPVYTTMDNVNWKVSTTTSGTADIPDTTPGSISTPIWYRDLSDGSWDPVELGPDCSTILSMVIPADTPTFAGWVDGSEPPTILTTSSISGGAIPAADIGLASPQITELLPNPAPPESDSEDEYFELYNPNSTAFDLSGFRVEAGVNNLRNYTFPNGTTIAAKSFKAFYSGDTGLSLTNSAGQVKLLDPLGNVISQTDVYNSAKSGQAWSSAKGKWYWSNSPTPGAANSVNQTAGGKPGPSSAGITRSLAATTGAPATPGVDDNGVAPLHPWTLAAVGSAALLYAGYEYRHDLANNLYRLRRYVAARRTAGK